ncbi:MAG: hypothetical protein L0387_24910 [Acidobacteria bacterium]|nr:hypothetical protein [Acidobacteriota bacterium]
MASDTVRKGLAEAAEKSAPAPQQQPSAREWLLKNWVNHVGPMSSLQDLATHPLIIKGSVDAEKMLEAYAAQRVAAVERELANRCHLELAASERARSAEAEVVRLRDALLIAMANLSCKCPEMNAPIGIFATPRHEERCAYGIARAAYITAPPSGQALPKETK